MYLPLIYMFQSHTWPPKLSICFIRTEDSIRDQLFVSRGALLSVLSYNLVNASAKHMFNGVCQYKKVEYQKLITG